MKPSMNPEKNLKVVLDANIFVSAFIKPSGPPGQILKKFLKHQAFELIISKPSTTFSKESGAG